MSSAVPGYVPAKVVRQITDGGSFLRNAENCGVA